MEFGLTEEQVLLQDSVGRYLADNAGLERARQFADGGEAAQAANQRLGLRNSKPESIHAGIDLKPDRRLRFCE